MAKTNSLKEVPFEESWRYEGNEEIHLGWHMASYAEGYRPVEWRPNTPFKATFDLTGQSRGRSSALFEWTDLETQTRYPMFMSSLVDLIQNSVIRNGVVSGTWIAVKRGANYGIERYEEKND